jgi:hypothetical protein
MKKIIMTAIMVASLAFVAYAQELSPQEIKQKEKAEKEFVKKHDKFTKKILAPSNNCESMVNSHINVYFSCSYRDGDYMVPQMPTDLSDIYEGPISRGEDPAWDFDCSSENIFWGNYPVMQKINNYEILSYISGGGFLPDALYHIKSDVPLKIEQDYQGNIGVELYGYCKVKGGVYKYTTTRGLDASVKSFTIKKQPKATKQGVERFWKMKQAEQDKKFKEASDSYNKEMKEYNKKMAEYNRICDAELKKYRLSLKDMQDNCNEDYEVTLRIYNNATDIKDYCSTVKTTNFKSSEFKSIAFKYGISVPKECY